MFHHGVTGQPKLLLIPKHHPVFKREGKGRGIKERNFDETAFIMSHDGIVHLRLFRNGLVAFTVLVTPDEKIS